MSHEPITQQRVAAAFEAWFSDVRDGGPLTPSTVRGQDETIPHYAQRLAASLFKYLERV